MRKVLSSYIILQLLYLTSIVKSLNGPKVISARHGEFPYVASLEHYPEGGRFCTGVLITKNYVITVAHCIADKESEKIRSIFEVASTSSDIITAYKVDSWVTYDKWADSRGIKKEPGTHNIAVLKLQEKVYQPNVKPVRLSTLHYKQIQGKKAVVTGWRGYGLLKGLVDILSDKECQRNIRLITNHHIEISSRVLCTAAVPKILLEKGDGGAPIVDDNKTLLGVSIGYAPASKHAFTHYSDEFLQQYQVNLHVSVDYYRKFIISTTGYQ